MVKWVKKGMAKRPTGRTRKVSKAASRSVRALIRSEAKKEDEQKFYAYQPVASAGPINTNGLLYLLNAMPYARSTVTGGVVDQTAGLQGAGSNQVLGKEYLVSRLRVRAQMNITTDAPQVVRCIVFREHSPEGIVPSMASLVANVGGGAGSLAPLFSTNILNINKNGGRFMVYADKTMTLIPSITGSWNIRSFIFEKRFATPVKVKCYDTLNTLTVGTNGVVGNIQQNAFWMVIFGSSTPISINQVWCSLDYLDA